MKTKDIIEGLTILEKYREKPNGYNCGAEHDVFYAYATDKPLSKEDLDRMIELGWLQEVDEDEEEDFEAKSYDPEESWQCFT